MPTRDTLHAAALAHLSRYSTSSAGLARVLDRRIARWAREQEDQEAAAPLVKAAHARAAEVVARLVQAGAVSDVTFAQARARSLARAGKSRRAIASHLAQRGVPAALGEAAVPRDAETELAAALLHARRRRAGPFGPGETTPEAARRVLASFARAGFSQATALAALRMARDEAEARIAAFRAAL